MTVSVTEALVTTFEPWSALYADSRVLPIGLTFAHLGAMMIGGGLALGADRQVLRASRGSDAAARTLLADTVGDVHRPVVIALLVSLCSGLLQLAADLEALLPNRVLWVKLALLLLLLGNGALMLRDERALRRSPEGASAFDALRIRAIVSVTLWLAILAAGVGLMQG